MFCRKTKNNKNENIVSQAATQKSSFEYEYVEIKNMTREFFDINQIAYAINDIDRKMEAMHKPTFFYQKNIKEAYLDEWQRRYISLMGKDMSLNDYWKTRAI